MESLSHTTISIESYGDINIGLHHNGTEIILQCDDIDYPAGGATFQLSRKESKAVRRALKMAEKAMTDE